MGFIAHDTLQSVQGVAAGGTFTCEVPTGFSYHDFFLQLGGTTFDESHLSDLKLWINGKVVQHIRTGTELDNVNQFDRLAAHSTERILRWPLERTGLDLREARERTVIGTGISEAKRRTLQNPQDPNYDPVRVANMHITGTIAAGASAPTLSIQARRSAPRPTGVVGKIRNFTRNPSGAGIYEISDLPQNEPISRVIFKDSAGAGDITRVELYINNIKVFDRTPDMNDKVQTDGVRTPQAGYFVYDPAEDGAGSNSPLIGPTDDVRWNITTDDELTLEIQYNTLGYLDA